MTETKVVPSSKRKKHGGRAAGTPNKATADVRAAIAQLLESNVDNFSVWLAAVAAGEKEAEPITDEDGKPILDPVTQKPLVDLNWLRRPDPATALKLAMDMAEFHIPKLARTELTGKDGNAIQVKGTLEFVSPVHRPIP
jgi:hypothetical protein